MDTLVLEEGTGKKFAKIFCHGCLFVGILGRCQRTFTVMREVIFGCKAGDVEDRTPLLTSEAGL